MSVNKMIKIDGEKIKQLRESQGLTQLYMATAVEVTTDTISRWENKRYPTIKEENAQKLAEALGVEVDEILLIEEENSQNGSIDQTPSPAHATATGPRRRHKPLMLRLLLVAGAVVIAGLVTLKIFFSQAPDPHISAIRIMPPRTLPESAFPVVIDIGKQSKKVASIIIKETIPQGCEILQTSPSDSASVNGREIKWLYKLKDTVRFSYLAKIKGKTGDSFTFNGTVSTSHDEESIQVAGESSITLDQYHWADLDGDSTISDKEILTVFDYYSGIDDFTIDIEFIEKMWLGSGYSWDREKNLISITP